MKKKLAVLLAGTMVMASLAACGGSEAPAEQAAAPAATEEEPAAEEPAAEEPAAEEPAAEEPAAEEPAAEASGELIKVGIINNDPNESGYRTANVNDL